MSFLDNSGDIILDAVLTDAGRKRLARADGTFKIAKFALGDDEIDYSLYNYNNTSGSAYYDLSLLQTPILEAFTNNTSILKSRLISLPQTNQFYLPVIKLNTNVIGLSPSGNSYDGGGVIYITADNETDGKSSTPPSSNNKIDETKSPFVVGSVKNYLYGSPSGPNASSLITIDQGLDTNAIPATQGLDSSLIESQYIIEIDNRLGTIVGSTGTPLSISFIDDDNIASYYLSSANDAQITSIASNDSLTNILGPRGTRLAFKVVSSINLQQSTYLFDLLGATATYPSVKTGGTATYYYIDTNIRITGATTGASIDLPVRFLKYKTT